MQVANLPNILLFKEMKYPLSLQVRIGKMRAGVGAGEGYLDSLTLPQSARSPGERFLRPALPPSRSPALPCGMRGSPGGACGQDTQLNTQLLRS